MKRLLQNVHIDERCQVRADDQLGPFVRLGDGRILTVADNATLTSSDGGDTWSKPRAMYRGKGGGRPSSGGVMARTRDGILVYVYMDIAGINWSWSEARREAGKDVRLDVWAVRSVNDGKTWSGRQRIFEGYCGALIGMIETSTGELVVPVQRLLRDPSRHAICTYVSADSGKSWQPGNIIDLGGHGHHDGAMEPTLVELKDGRLWMLIRTNLDRFWQAFSEDRGRSWRVLEPSGIDASSSPGYLLRLASGRLALVWNRLLPKGRKRYPRRGGDCQLSAARANWQREEVSLAFSDDGQEWSEPQVILRVKGGGPSYPYIFEPEPGQLWVATLFRDRFGLALREADFS